MSIGAGRNGSARNAQTDPAPAGRGTTNIGRAVRPA